MEELERVLEDLERVFHVHIQWKSVGRGNPSCGLSERHTFHGCEFCRRVKAEKRRYRLCSENDDILLPRLAGIEKGAFVHTCHAGVSELVVPLFEGDRCTEVFLAGVFRRENGESDAAEGDIPVMKEEMLKNLQELLSDLSGILRARRDSLRREVRTGEIRDSRIRRTVEYLEQNFSRRIRVKDLAAACSLSESRFLHLFRQEAGCPVVAFLTKVRLNAARELLELSGSTISDVMEHCGFRDQSRFGRLFREFTGFTPLVYHRKFRRRTDV